MSVDALFDDILPYVMVDGPFVVTTSKALQHLVSNKIRMQDDASMQVVIEEARRML